MEIHERKAMLLMCLCAFLWSIGGLFIKLLPWHAAVICGLRSFIAAVIILVYMRCTGCRLALKNPLVWLSGLGLMGTMLLFVFANKLTTSANAIVLQSTSPLYIMVIAALFLGARYSRRELVMVGIVMAGITLFFFDQLTPGGLLGNLLALLSGLTMALMYTASGRLPDAAAQRLLERHIFGLIIGRLRVGDIVQNRPLFCPLEMRRALQHNHGVGCEKVRHDRPPPFLNKLGVSALNRKFIRFENRIFSPPDCARGLR